MSAVPQAIDGSGATVHSAYRIVGIVLISRCVQIEIAVVLIAIH